MDLGRTHIRYVPGDLTCMLLDDETPGREGPLAQEPTVRSSVDHGFDFRQARRPQLLESLLPLTKAWLAALPDVVRPSELAQYYPRLANRFAAFWHDAPSVAALFEKLLIDDRGNRRGFALHVLDDLKVLRRYWGTMVATLPVSIVTVTPVAP